ncbi:MAG TPA: T9SS type A sorting domain-containing protein, partial [Bacteroidia bacterium]|nr:T9SS type A sorting domain-containing protein [Bacteroidia bacterium]
VTGDTLWTKTYGGALNEGGAGRQTIEPTFDGGYIIGGFSSSFFTAGGLDAYLIKTDANGNAAWSKMYGGSGSETINDVKQTSDSGYIFTGYTTSFGAGSADIFLIKTNSVGDTVYTRTFGGGLTDAGQGILETSDKGFVICGYTTNYGSGNNDALLIKIDSLGNSPCHQNNTNTVVSNPATIVGNTTTGKIFITLNASSPTFVTKSGGNTIDACIANAIMENTERAGIKIFPNPNNGNFILDFSQNNSSQYIIRVNTTLGETIYSNTVSNTGKKEINLEHLTAGTYLLQLFATDKIYTQQIFIAK